MNKGNGFKHTVLMIVLCFVPLLFFVWVIASGAVVSPWITVFFLLFFLFIMYYAIGKYVPDEVRDEAAPVKYGEPSAKDVPDDLILKIVDILSPVEMYRAGDHYFIEGRLLLEPDAALEELQRRFAGTSLTPLLQESASDRPMLVLVPPDALPAGAKTAGGPWLNIGLFLATLVTTTWAGAVHQGINVLEQPERLSDGLPYAVALMLILGAHELGHYFTARRNALAVTLPYFIPIPFALGTFGAFIRMKSLAQNRRVAFDVAVAGPLAGLLVAVPALIFGLPYSTVAPDSAALSAFMGGTDVGSSVLFAFLAKATLGEAVLEGHRLILHPIAFAGWLGLLITALNLIPVGQLDGGHMAHALLGRQSASAVGISSLMALVLLGLFVWSGLLFWAVLIFFVAGTRHTPPVNDVSRLNRGRVVLGAATFALLLLILIPVPHALYQAFGIHSPYV